ncbi:hypothetical protein [Echinicola sediminis]
MKKYCLIVAIILLTKINGLGCSCAESDIFSSYESALNVFKGEILSEGEVELYDTLYVGYNGLNCATLFGQTVPGLSV